MIIASIILVNHHKNILLCDMFKRVKVFAFKKNIMNIYILIKIHNTNIRIIKFINHNFHYFLLISSNYILKKKKKSSNYKIQVRVMIHFAIVHIVQKLDLVEICSDIKF